MAMKKQRRALVSSVSARIRNTTYEGTKNVVATKEETIERKKVFLDVLDKSMEKIIDNLNNGKMTLDTSLDLDRIIKLSLLVSGEADSITAKSGSETVNEASLENHRLSIEKVEEILDDNDPDVKAMFDKLYAQYNELNDRED